MCYRIVAGAVLLAGGLCAQTSVFDKPPAGVEEALRARITKFYQSFVDGKFRQADEVVAEDSKDDFFALNKSRYYGFEIRQITFEDNFTKARALVMVDSDMQMFASRARTKVPLTSMWQLENGEWWLHIPKLQEAKEVITPFGKISREQMEKSKAAEGPPPGMPVRVADFNSLAKLVHVDRSQVAFESKTASTVTVTIQNSVQGRITLEVAPTGVPGLTATLNRKELGANEQARLELRYAPVQTPPRGRFTVKVVAMPLNLAIPIDVDFSAPGR